MSTKLHTKSYNNKRLFLTVNPNEDIAENDPVRVVDAIVEGLDLREFKKLYHEKGRCPYHPKMMLKIILYAYMNNIYSCRKMERAVQRDIHYIWLAAQERPDFVTINRFRNRVKKEINNIFTQVVLVLADKGFITLDVEYIDGTKIESKANKYTFVWRKTVEKNRAKLQEKIRVLLGQIDDAVAQDKASETDKVDFTPDTLTSSTLFPTDTGIFHQSQWPTLAMAPKRTTALWTKPAWRLTSNTTVSTSSSTRVTSPTRSITTTSITTPPKITMSARWASI